MRDCIGHATDAAETAGQIDMQPFHQGTFDDLLLVANTPGGRVAYVTWRGYLGGSSCIPNGALCRPDHERFSLPRP